MTKPKSHAYDSHGVSATELRERLKSITRNRIFVARDRTRNGRMNAYEVPCGYIDAAIELLEKGNKP